MLIDAVQRRTLRQAAELCAASLGTRGALLDHSLCPVETFAHDETGAGALCHRVKAVPDGAAQCSAAHEKGARRAVQLDGAYFYACHAELVEGIVPFEHDGNVLAYILVGPVIVAPVDRLLTDRIAARVCAFGVSEKVARNEIGYIPVVEAERLKRALNLLDELVSSSRDENDGVPQERGTAAAQGEPAAASLAPERSRCHRRMANSSSVKQRLVLANSRLAGAAEIRQDIYDLISSKAAWDFSPDIARAAALETVAALWHTALRQDGRAIRIVPRASILSGLFRTKTFADVVDWASDAIRRMGRDAGTVPPPSRSALRRVRKYVRRSLAEQLSPANVAHEAGIDPHELDRMLQRHFDITFRQYLTMERLALARKLLRESDLTATEIAAKTGFSDQSNFTKMFEKFEGMTPIQYRTRSISAKSLLSDDKKESKARTR